MESVKCIKYGPFAMNVGLFRNTVQQNHARKHVRKHFIQQRIDSGMPWTVVHVNHQHDVYGYEQV